jgi:hypothetical protein
MGYISVDRVALYSIFKVLKMKKKNHHTPRCYEPTQFW